MALARAVALALALAASAALGRMALEPEALASGHIRNPAWLPNGSVLRLASLGQRLVFSDYYWLKLVQYVGETVLSKQQRWEALYPLAEIVTDLDPRHGYAYQVAGSNLSGLALRFDEAERIVQKGIRNLPDRWQLYFVAAVNKFYFEGDFAEAARYARLAADVGKRPHLALLAANLSLAVDSEGEYQAAEALVAEAVQQAETPELKEELERRLGKVRTYRVLSEVEKALAAYEQRQGRRPVTLLALVTEGLLPGLPSDPSGGEILYDPSTGEVRSSVVGARKPVRNTFKPQ